MDGFIEGGRCLQPHLQGGWIANAGGLQLKGGLGLEQLLLFQWQQPETCKSSPALYERPILTPLQSPSW